MSLSRFILITRGGLSKFRTAWVVVATPPILASRWRSTPIVRARFGLLQFRNSGSYVSTASHHDRLMELSSVRAFRTVLARCLESRFMSAERLARRCTNVHESEGLRVRRKTSGTSRGVSGILRTWMVLGGVPSILFDAISTQVPISRLKDESATDNPLVGRATQPLSIIARLKRRVPA